MFAQLFGKYLEEENIISKEVRENLQRELSTARTKMGFIAVTEGMITGEQADEINHIQVTENKRFGDIALEKGYLSVADIDTIIKKQGSESSKYFQLLNEKANISLGDIEKHLEAFKSAKGFTDEEFESVKADNHSALLDLYCVTREDLVRDLVGIVVNNITRFVSTDFYFDRVKKVSDLEYTVITGIDGTCGDKDIYLGFVGIKEPKGITTLAQDYAIDIKLLSSNDVYDALGEFANMNMGLLASEVEDKLNLELKPPKVYIGQKASGDCYILPIHLHNVELHIVIATGKDFKVGNSEYVITSNKAEITDSETTDTSKKRVLIVDDSILMRKMLRGILESINYKVVGEGTNGEDAVELYKKLKPDVVTLDITMPETESIGDGIDALQKILEYDKDANVMMLSAAGQQDKIVQSLKIGAKLFVTKPFTEEEVILNISKM